ncbi:MAG: DUF4357 domain-containing protein [Neisseriales bacterium]|nr:MAG: DUF4357 domain-containing protein [Neisseriales bacterium]
MKITKLKIKGYKGLDVNFEHHSDIITFIGLNGSGKSNVLEAICYIFREIYSDTESDYIEIAKKIPFKFELSFSSDSGGCVNITNISDQTMSLVGQIIDHTKYSASDDSFLFPQKLVAVYSGEEKRLWTKFFKSSFDEYIKQLSTETRLKPQRMIFLSRKHWDISLLTLLISELQDAKDFVRNVLKIMNVNKVEFKFNHQRYKSWKENSTHAFIKNIDFKSEYSLDEIKDKLAHYIEVDIFSHFYNALLSEMIASITITFNDELTLNDLSEGEKKLLLLKAAFEFVAQEDSLFLLDEPDSHIHLNNKPHIINIISQYKHNRQFILTTHSPTLTQCIKDLDNSSQNRIYALDSGKNVDSIRAKAIEYLAGDFWNAQQQTAFLSTKKDVILLVEGKHDKSHILNAWKHYRDDYPDLDFDIFVMGCADNITHLITGLRVSDNQDENKKYIGIFDNDESGRNNHNKSNVKYSENIKASKKGFVTIIYPVPNNFPNKKDFTVENLLPLQKYEESYKEVINTHNFTMQKIDDTLADIQKRVKGMLADKSNSFSKSDFVEFKKLFDIVNEIADLNNSTPIGVHIDVVKSLEPQSNSNIQNSLIIPANNQLNIFADYGPRGHPRNRYDAIFDKTDKSVLYNGEKYSSANQAMVFIRKEANNGASIGGVQAGVFWKYLNEDGAPRPLSDFLK